MTDPVVVMVQPIYGTVPPRADALQKQWITINLARKLLHWYQPFIGAYIDEACNRLCSWVIESIPQATHVLIVEQDMVLPEETLEALLSAEKGVISATYFYKDKDATCVGFDKLGPPAKFGIDNFIEDEVQQVAGTGMGCLLITVDLLKRMQVHFKDSLWFQCQQMVKVTEERADLLDATDRILRQLDHCGSVTSHDPAAAALRDAAIATEDAAEKSCRRTKGQDWHFCKRLEKMGVPVFLDGRVCCEHLTDASVTIEQWRAAKERRLAVQS